VATSTGEGYELITSCFQARLRTGWGARKSERATCATGPIRSTCRIASRPLLSHDHSRGSRIPNQMSGIGGDETLRSSTCFPERSH
jgi:hypothetical protein